MSEIRQIARDGVAFQIRAVFCIALDRSGEAGGFELCLRAVADSQSVIAVRRNRRRLATSLIFSRDAGPIAEAGVHGFRY